MQEREQAIITQALTNPLSAMRKLTMGKLYYFIQYFWPSYSQETFVPNWHIEYICSELEKVARQVASNQPREYDLIINVPPGTTKTAMVSIFFPIWCWVNWFWMRFITFSYAQPLSLESAEYSRDVIRSEMFKEMFPEIDIKEDKDTKSNFRIVKYVSNDKLSIGGNRYSTSVSGGGTGFHGHINIVDDPIDPMQSISDAEIENANYFMDNVLPMRKVDKRITVTILLMQRLHPKDPTGYWLKTKGNKVRHVCLPGEITNFAKNVKPPELIKNYVDGLLDPNRLNWDALNEIHDRGQYVYGGQVGQDPVPLGGGMFKTDHITVMTRIPPPQDFVSTVRYWDKAGTEGGTGAFTAGVKMSKLKNGTFLVENIKRGRWASEEREKIIKLCAQSDTEKCRIGIEQEPGSGGLESAEATVRNLSGFVTDRDHPTGKKVYRADPYSVQVNNGNVALLQGEWNNDYIEELKYFPNSTYKDQTDASSGAFALLTRFKQAEVVKR